MFGPGRIKSEDHTFNTRNGGECDSKRPQIGSYDNLIINTTWNSEIQQVLRRDYE